MINYDGGAVSSSPVFDKMFKKIGSGKRVVSKFSIHFLVAEYIAKNYNGGKIIELAGGNIPDTALLIQENLPKVEVIFTDAEERLISPIRTDYLELRVEIFDIFNPSSLLEGAKLLYAINPYPYLVPSIKLLADFVGSDLLLVVFLEEQNVLSVFDRSFLPTDRCFSPLSFGLCSRMVSGWIYRKSEDGLRKDGGADKRIKNLYWVIDIENIRTLSKTDGGRRKEIKLFTTYEETINFLKKMINESDSTILILITGHSRSGKTYLAEKLVNVLELDNARVKPILEEEYLMATEMETNANYIREINGAVRDKIKVIICDEGASIRRFEDIKLRLPNLEVMQVRIGYNYRSDIRKYHISKFIHINPFNSILLKIASLKGPNIKEGLLLTIIAELEKRLKYKTDKSKKEIYKEFENDIRFLLPEEYEDEFIGILKKEATRLDGGNYMEEIEAKKIERKGKEHWTKEKFLMRLRKAIDELDTVSSRKIREKYNDIYKAFYNNKDKWNFTSWKQVIRGIGYEPEGRTKEEFLKELKSAVKKLGTTLSREIKGKKRKIYEAFAYHKKQWGFVNWQQAIKEMEEAKANDTVLATATWLIKFPYFFPAINRIGWTSTTSEERAELYNKLVIIAKMYPEEFWKIFGALQKRPIYAREINEFWDMIVKNRIGDKGEEVSYKNISNELMSGVFVLDLNKEREIILVVNSKSKNPDSNDGGAGQEKIETSPISSRKTLIAPSVLISFFILGIFDRIFRKGRKKETIVAEKKPAVSTPDAKIEEEKSMPEEPIFENKQEAMQWRHTSFKEAVREAEKTGRKMLIYFAKDINKCLACKAMQQEVFSDVNLQKLLNDNFICVKTESEEDRWEYGVDSTPVLIFTDSIGKEIYPRIIGGRRLWQIETIVANVMGGVYVSNIESFIDNMLSEQARKIIRAVSKQNPSLIIETPLKKLLVEEKEDLIKEIIKYLWMYRIDREKVQVFEDNILKQIRTRDKKRWGRYTKQWKLVNGALYGLIQPFEVELKKWSDWKRLFKDKIGIVVKRDNSGSREEKVMILVDALEALTKCEVGYTTEHPNKNGDNSKLITKKDGGAYVEKIKAEIAPYGEIIKKHVSTAAGNLIIFIQDNHVSTSGRLNALKIIDVLKIDFISLEGAGGIWQPQPLTQSLIKNKWSRIPKNKLRKVLLDFFAKGEFSFEQYLEFRYLYVDKLILFAADDKELSMRQREILKEIRKQMERDIGFSMVLEMSFGEEPEEERDYSINKFISDNIYFLLSAFGKDKEFDERTAKRSRAIVVNTLAELAKENKSEAVTLVGFQHTDSIVEAIEELNKRGKEISYIVVRPFGIDVISEKIDKNYLGNLFGGISKDGGVSIPMVYSMIGTPG